MAVTEDGEGFFGARMVGVIMHSFGFEGQEVIVDGSRCRGFGGIALKPLAIDTTVGVAEF